MAERYRQSLELHRIKSIGVEECLIFLTAFENDMTRIAPNHGRGLEWTCLMIQEK